MSNLRFFEIWSKLEKIKVDYQWENGSKNYFTEKASQPQENLVFFQKKAYRVIENLRSILRGETVQKIFAQKGPRGKSVVFSKNM